MTSKPFEEWRQGRIGGRANAKTLPRTPVRSEVPDDQSFLSAPTTCCLRSIFTAPSTIKQLFTTTLRLSAGSLHPFVSASLRSGTKFFPPHTCTLLVMKGGVARSRQTRRSSLKLHKFSQEKLLEAVASEGAGMHVGIALVEDILTRQVKTFRQAIASSF